MRSIPSFLVRPFEWLGLGPGRSHAPLRCVTPTHREAQGAASGLLSTDQYARSIVRSSIDMIIAVDNDRRITEFNPAAELAFGYRREEVLGQPVDVLYDDSGEGDAIYNATVRTGEWSGEVINRHKDGRIFPSVLSASVLYDGGGRQQGVLGISRDISVQKDTERRVHDLEYRDELSGLPNRNHFRLRLADLLLEESPHGGPAALLIIDLDRFKNINDTLGHAVGDKIIREIGLRVGRYLRNEGFIARIGGDEFAVLALVGETAAADLAEQILALISMPFNLPGMAYNLSASVGVSLYPRDGTEPDTLLKNADIAMYRAKAIGRNNIQFYSPQSNIHSVERLMLESSLARALSNNEFSLHYQPKMNLATGRVTGVEALIRWHHPQFGPIPPSRFIPLAEECGLMDSIGAWVLRTACERSRRWREYGINNLRIAVNLSAREFANPKLIQSIKQTLAQTQMAPADLEIEITESMVMDNPDEAVSFLNELRAMGIHLSIDDFGTGYSSLSYLSRLPISTIKIDRSFIKEIPASLEDMAITKAVISIARNLNLGVIAEGVETEAQAAALCEIGCEEMQGYFISPPLEEGALTAYLMEPERWLANTFERLAR